MAGSVRYVSVNQLSSLPNTTSAAQSVGVSSATTPSDSVASILKVDPNTIVTDDMLQKALRTWLEQHVPASEVDTFFNALYPKIKDTGAIGKTAGSVTFSEKDMIQQIQDTAGAILTLANTFATIIGKLTNPQNWLHIGAMLLGIIVVGGGIYLVSKDVMQTGPQGLISPIPIILKEGA